MRVLIPNKGRGVRYPRQYKNGGLKPNFSAIYFVLARDIAIRSHAGYVKVGYSSDPITRVLGFTTDCPLPIVAAWYVEILEKDVCFHEGMLHQALNKYGVHGEWFRIRMRSRKARNAFVHAIKTHFKMAGLHKIELEKIDLAAARRTMWKIVAKNINDKQDASGVCRTRKKFNERLAAVASRRKQE